MFYYLRLAFVIPLVYNVCSQYRFDCTAEYCKKVECGDLECNDGRIVKNATHCGCCHVCIKRLKEGESCKTEYKAKFDNLEECGPGLACNQKTKTCVTADRNCINMKKKDIEFHSNRLRMLKQRFECDEFGYYKPVICIPDVLCYCVDKHGTRIFGSDSAKHNDTMTCDCSLEINDFPRQVQDGNFPRCLSNGNYDPLQCTEDWCFCMGSYQDDVVNATDSIEKLTCYNKEKHENNNLRSKCLKEKLTQTTSYNNKNFTVIGTDIIRCDLDGSYFPVQCKRNSCFCVSKNGEQYIDYAVPRYSNEAKTMTCRCLRDKEILRSIRKKSKNMEFFEKFKCDGLGNYRSKQFVDSESFFVDEMGQIIDEDYH